MKPLRMREFAPDDRESVLRIWEDAFLGDNAEPSEEWFNLPGARLFVWEQDKAVCATARVHEFTASRGEAVLPCGGVAAVAVALPSRRAGVGTEIMRDCLAWMRSQGYPLSSLYAFRETWYRPLGYEVCGRRWKVSVPAVRLPTIASDLPTREVVSGDWRVLEPCHASWVQRYSGMNARSGDRWSKVLAPAGKQHTILAAGEPVEAYVVLRSTAEFSGEQAITEAVWATPEGYRAFLSILAKIGMNRSKVTWYEPPDLPYLMEHFDSDVEVSLARPIMFRANDVAGALRALKPEAKGEFTIEVEDETLPENRGPWAVRFKPGEVEVSAAPSAEVILDVRAFSQALLGQPSFEALAASGRVKAHSERALAAVAALLPGRDVYCLEFF